MGQLLNRWNGLTGRSGPLRFVDINLRGIGQVMFQDNPISGLLFLVAIGWGSYASGVPQVAIGGLLAVVVATLTAQWLRVEAAGLGSGLFGYNAFLVGIALPTFLDVSPLLWVYIVIGAAVSVIAMRATANVMGTWGVSALTAPFVLVTWLLLLSVNAFTGIEGGALPSSGLIVPIAPEASDPLRIGDFLSGILTQHLPGLRQGRCTPGPAHPRRSRRQLLGGGGIRPRRGRAIGRGRPPARRGESAHHRRPARLQPGADRDRAGHRALSTGPSGRTLRTARGGVHDPRPGRHDRGHDALRDPDPDRLLRARHLAVRACPIPSGLSRRAVRPSTRPRGACPTWGIEARAWEGEASLVRV